MTSTLRGAVFAAAAATRSEREPSSIVVSPKKSSTDFTSTDALAHTTIPLTTSSASVPPPNPHPAELNSSSAPHHLPNCLLTSSAISPRSSHFPINYHSRTRVFSTTYLPTTRSIRIMIRRIDRARRPIAPTRSPSWGWQDPLSVSLKKQGEDQAPVLDHVH